jgi:preprotein translocase subunit SecD
MDSRLVALSGVLLGCGPTLTGPKPGDAYVLVVLASETGQASLDAPIIAERLRRSDVNAAVRVEGEKIRLELVDAVPPDLLLDLARSWTLELRWVVEGAVAPGPGQSALRGCAPSVMRCDVGVVTDPAVITSVDIVTATANTEDSPSVTVELTEAAAVRFAEATASHVNQRLAIVLDGYLVSAPIVQEKIAGGSVVVTMGSGGADAVREAQALAVSLGRGSTPLSGAWQTERVEVVPSGGLPR